MNQRSSDYYRTQQKWTQKNIQFSNGESDQLDLKQGLLQLFWFQSNEIKNTPISQVGKDQFHSVIKIKFFRIDKFKLFKVIERWNGINTRKEIIFVHYLAVEKIKMKNLIHSIEFLLHFLIWLTQPNENPSTTLPFWRIHCVFRNFYIQFASRSIVCESECE